MKKIVIFALFSFFLIGCSSTPPNSKEIKSTPSERVFMYQTKKPDDATLSFIRDKGMVGSGCYINLFLNGKEVAKLETKEKANFYVTSGDIVVGASIEGKGLCSFNAPRRERNFIIKPNEKRTFRLFTDQNGNTDIMPTTLYD